jgi:Carboxypeptidase regulatory-like domain
MGVSKSRRDDRPTLRVLLCVALVCGWTVSLRGQVIQGTVTDSVTGAAVGRGFVVLLDEAGRELGRALTGRAGEFMLRAPGPGRYHLRSERIAFRSFTTQLIAIDSGETVELPLEVTALPSQLEDIVVTGETECVVRPTEGLQVSTLWDEAHKALAATVWTADQGLFLYLIERHTSELKRNLDVEETEVDTILISAAQPFVTEDPYTLVERGYVRPEGDEMVYDGVDARLFLSDPFLDTHCFRIRETGSRADTIGLAFEPVGSRDAADVTGVLWLDAKTAELRVLDFGYIHPPFSFKAERMGGRVEFIQLAGGQWIVQRWWIRTPRFERRRRFRVVLDGYTEHGAEVIQVFRVPEQPN